VSREYFEAGVKLAFMGEERYWNKIDKDALEKAYLDHLKVYPDDPEFAGGVVGALLGGGAGAAVGAPVGLTLADRLGRSGKPGLSLLAALGGAAAAPLLGGVAGYGIGRAIGRRTEPITPESLAAMSPEEKEKVLKEYWRYM